jgi:hypothetical protein
MSEIDGKVIEVHLEGGPPELPRQMRVRLTDDTRTKIKIAHLGGHEHFEPVAGTNDLPTPRVYQWTMRTRIAE